MADEPTNEEEVEAPTPDEGRPGASKLRGTILPNAIPADISLVGQGEESIHEQRAVLRDRVQNTKGALGRHTERLNEILQSRLNNAVFYQDKLTKKSQKMLGVSIKRNSGPAIHRTALEIKDQVELAMLQSLEAQNEVMQRQGMRGVTRSQMKQIIKQQMAGWAQERSPPDGPLTVAGRFRLHKQKLRDKLTKQIEVSRPVEDKMGAVRRDVKRAVDDRSPGRTAVKGGSTFKQMVRFSVAEQARKSNDVAVIAMQSSGLLFGTWNLSPAHQWYGGKEVCEQLAARHDVSIEKELRGWGMDIAKLDLTGVYWLSKWPAYPHPFCQCAPNLWMPEELRSILDTGMPVIHKVGAFPEELLPGAGVVSAERSAFSAAYNSVLSEVGLRPAVTPNLVAALGSKGLANALAPHIRNTKKTKAVMNNIRRALIISVRAAKKRMEDFERQVGKETAKIMANQTLSSASRAAFIAKRMTSLEVAMVQYQANMLSLRDIEEAVLNPAKQIITQSVGDQGNLFNQIRDDLGLSFDDVRIETKDGKFWTIIDNSKFEDILPAAERVLRKRQRRLRRIKAKGLDGGAEWRKAQDDFEEQPRKLERAWKRISKKYELKQARGVVSRTSRGEFRLGPEQSAGMEFIEEKQNVLLHFAPGLGKTPNVIASVSDLRAKRKINKALISPPAGVRMQFAREVLRFNATGRLTLYFPASSIKKLTEEMLDGVVKDVMDGNDLWKKGDKVIQDNKALDRAKRALRGELKWRPKEIDGFTRIIRENMGKTEFSAKERKMLTRILDNKLPNLRNKNNRAVYESMIAKVTPGFVDEAEKKEYERLDAIGRKKAAKLMERVDVKPILTDMDAMKKEMSKDTNLFTIMGHNDLANNASHLAQHFDYIAIDEIHQLTSSETTSGSAKANALQNLVGGRIKYKVGLTGTAAKNNVGEFWDISKWLRPEHLPDKDVFMKQYEALTLESNHFSEAVIKMLRKDIDSYVFTLPSPVKAKLFSFVNPDITEEERAKVFRKVELTKEQVRRAQEIEDKFQVMQNASEQLREKWDAQAKEDIGWDEMTPEEQAKAKSDTTKVLKKAVERRRIAEWKKLENYQALYNRELKRMGIVDRDSPQAAKKLPRPGSKRRKKFDRLESQMNNLSNILSPTSWRDNQHFINLHVGTSKTNAKMKEVMRLFDTDLKGEKVIIHAERFKTIDMLKRELEAVGKKVFTFTGSMSGSNQQASLKAFNAGEGDVMILSRAGSTGLNVQKMSHHTIHFDIPQTYAEYVQREARNWRNGQEKDVWSYMLHNDDSALDRRRLELFTTKKRILATIDEITKVSDVGNPLDNLKRMRKAGVKSFAALKKSQSSKEVEAALKKICASFRRMGIVTSSCAKYEQPGGGEKTTPVVEQVRAEPVAVDVRRQARNLAKRQRRLRVKAGSFDAAITEERKKEEAWVEAEDRLADLQNQKVSAARIKAQEAAVEKALDAYDDANYISQAFSGTDEAIAHTEQEALAATKKYGAESAEAKEAKAAFNRQVRARETKEAKAKLARKRARTKARLAADKKEKDRG